VIRDLNRRLDILESVTKPSVAWDWLHKLPPERQQAILQWQAEMGLPLPIEATQYQRTIALRHLQAAILSGDFAHLQAYVAHVHASAKRNRESN
jgi:hypothetical protein